MDAQNQRCDNGNGATLLFSKVLAHTSGQSRDNQTFLVWWVSRFSKVWGSPCTPLACRSSTDIVEQSQVPLPKSYQQIKLWRQSNTQLGTYQCSPCRMLFYPLLKATETTDKNNLLSQSPWFISHWIRLDPAIIRWISRPVNKTCQCIIIYIAITA